MKKRPSILHLLIRVADIWQATSKWITDLLYDAVPQATPGTVELINYYEDQITRLSLAWLACRTGNPSEFGHLSLAELANAFEQEVSNFQKHSRTLRERVEFAQPAVLRAEQNGGPGSSQLRGSLQPGPSIELAQSESSRKSAGNSTEHRDGPGTSPSATVLRPDGSSLRPGPSIQQRYITRGLESPLTGAQ